MNANAVIFDKDGTLIDFDAFWVRVSVKAIEDVLEALGQDSAAASDILEAFGVHDGITDIDGVLCKGTYEQMGRIVFDILKKYGCGSSCDEVTQIVVEAYNRNADAGEVKPSCSGLYEVLLALKKQGKRLAVVTTDNLEITKKCLEKLGVLELFDRVYTDDGVYPTKPDPYCVLDFCERFGLSREEVVMVGDTVTDVRFAENAGISVIGIAKNENNHRILAQWADAVVDSPAGLIPLLGG